MKSEMIKTLRKAKALIKNYGWTRNTFGDYQVGFCLLGAIREAAPDDMGLLGLSDKLSQAIAKREEMSKEMSNPDAHSESVAHYNDFMLKSKADALRLYDEAIALAKQEDK